MKKIFLITLTIIFFTGCVSQSEYDKLKTENEELKIQIDELLNGEERMKAEIDKYYAEKNYKLAKNRIQKLFEVHPQVNKDSKLKSIEKEIDRQITIEEQKKEAAEKEKIRLENINNTGMWKLGYYVDDFGEPTKEGYIVNKELIRGVFENTATQDSKLDVKFLITNSSDISIQLYEYAGNNPVKAYSSERYRVLIQDKDGKRLQLIATNYSDRLSFDKPSSRKVHSILLKGGSIKFKIIEVDTSTTQYDFKISDATWYGNAYRILQES